MRTSLAILLALSCGCAASEAPAPCAFDLLHINDPLYGDLLQLQGEDACVRLTRRDLSEPDMMYKARPWALETLTVSHPEGHEEVTGDLQWISSHHNWADAARGRGALYDYRVDVRFERLNDDGDYGFRYTLSGLDEAGEVSLGPFDLE